MQRRRAPEPVGGHDVRRLDLVDGDELQAARHGQARRLLAVGGQRAQVRVGRGATSGRGPAAAAMATSA